MSPKSSRATNGLATDLALIAALIGLAVVARLLPHAPNFTPVVATALFAATALRRRSLALVVPVAALLISDAVLGFYDWRMMSVVYAALALPALAGLLARGRARLVLVPALLSCSLTFFAASNFAVWAFSGMYAPTLDGLIKCYVAALPFLQNTLMGDLFWSAILFGGAFLWRTLSGTALSAVAKAA